MCVCDCVHVCIYLIEPPSPGLLCLHLREVVIVGDKIGHDRLVVWSRYIDICSECHQKSECDTCIKCVGMEGKEE